MMGSSVLLVLALLCLTSYASSHSEAPGTVTSPKSDLTDFYMFRSWENSSNTVFLMNINGLQDTISGPNYSPIPSDFVYNIHVENTGDAVEDITFQFVAGARFSGVFDPVRGTGAGLAIHVPHGDGTAPLVKVALGHIGGLSAADESAANFLEHYQLRVFNGPTSASTNVDAGPFATNNAGGSQILRKPFDYAGEKTFGAAPAYDNYAKSFVHSITIPGCAFPGRVFVGQRLEPFYINLGKIFDLVNLCPVEELGPVGTCGPDATQNALKDRAVTTFALEVPTSCIVGSSGGVIGGWASVRHLNHVGTTAAHVTGVQKNRLGMPLTNELLIGLTDKDAWNAAHPANDAQWLQYFELPTLPEIIDILFNGPVRAAIGGAGSIAPAVYPRVDLREIFLHGVPSLNTQTFVSAAPGCSTATAPPYADMLRLNTNIAPAAPASQLHYGVLELDFAGFPNGRRPGDDVVDIALRVAMGRICHPPFDTLLGICTPAQAPVGTFSIGDRVPLDANQFDPTFPFLKAPLPGSR